MSTEISEWMREAADAILQAMWAERVNLVNPAPIAGIIARHFAAQADRPSAAAPKSNNLGDSLDPRGGKVSFVEFTSSDDQLVLINSDKILCVKDEIAGTWPCLIVGENASDIRINVKQSFEEIKKRLGLVITPRAGTIAQI